MDVLTDGHDQKRPILLLSDIEKLRAQKFTWREIAQMEPYKSYEIPAGTLCSFNKFITNKWRPLFGLPATIPVPACSACGQAHAIDRACEKRVIVRDKPKPRKQRDRYRRYYAWLFEDMTVAEDWK